MVQQTFLMKFPKQNRVVLIHYPVVVRYMIWNVYLSPNGMYGTFSSPMYLYAGLMILFANSTSSIL